MIYHIVATSSNGIIGDDNKLPWHFSEDLKNFKKLTTGQTVIMGRKTYESIGKPLPNRQNFVLSRSEQSASDGVTYFQSIEDAIQAIETEDAFIIGGEDLFRQTFGLIDGIYLSKIERNYDGDAIYPDIPEIFSLREESTLRQSDPKIQLRLLLKNI